MISELRLTLADIENGLVEDRVEEIVEENLEEATITEATQRKPRKKEKLYVDKMVKLLANSVSETTPEITTYNNPKSYDTYIKFPVEYSKKAVVGAKSVAKKLGFTEAWKSGKSIGYVKDIDDNTWYEIVVEDFSGKKEDTFSMMTASITIGEE